MQPSALLDSATRSGLVALLQQTRVSAMLYEAGAKRYPRALPFATLARTERRHERLLREALLRARASLPPPPPLSLSKELGALLKQAVQQEQETQAEAERCLGFVRPRALVDLLTVIQLTSRDEHLPLLKKKLGPSPPKPTKAELQRLRGR